MILLEQLGAVAAFFKTRNGWAIVKIADADQMRRMLSGSSETSDRPGIIRRSDNVNDMERWCRTKDPERYEVLPLSAIAKELNQ